MIDQFNQLSIKLQSYKPLVNGGIDWDLIKDILNGVVDMLVVIANTLPGGMMWLSAIFKVAAGILSQIINLLPDNDNDEE